MRETTALGAAIAAGFAVDVWEEFEELKEVNQSGRTMFKPSLSKAQSASLYKRWERAVDMSRGWVDANEGDDSNA